MDSADAVRGLFDTEGFPARWNCGTGWTQALGWLHIGADWAIFGAYAAIPLVLAIFLRRRRDIPFPATGWLFVAFILSCGVTHLVDSVMFYRPAYRFLGLMKVITAGASLITVVSLVKIMPSVLKVPAIHRENVELKSDLTHREREARSLERIRDQLEARSVEATRRLVRLRDALEAAAVFAVQWEPGSDRIAWQLGSDKLFTPLDMTVLTDWTMLLGPRGAAGLRGASAALGADQELDVSLPIEGDPAGRMLRIVARPTLEGSGGPRMLCGLARVVSERAAAQRTA